MTDQPPRRNFVRIREFAEIVGLPQSTVRTRLQRDHWPHYRVGRAILLDVDEVLAAIRGGEDGWRD